MITKIQYARIGKGDIVIGDPVNTRVLDKITKGKEYTVFGTTKARKNDLVGITDDNGTNSYYSLKNFNIKP